MRGPLPVFLSFDLEEVRRYAQDQLGEDINVAENYTARALEIVALIMKINNIGGWSGNEPIMADDGVNHYFIGNVKVLP